MARYVVLHRRTRHEPCDDDDAPLDVCDEYEGYDEYVDDAAYLEVC